LRRLRFNVSFNLEKRFEELVMPRLFTALEIPQSAGLSLSLLRGGLPGARWIDRESYHITLRFIGDVDHRTADDIVNGLDRVHRGQFDLTLNGAGLFGSKKPHSIWAGVQATPELMALHADHERICQKIGLPPEPRKFTPHVTLARLKNVRVDDVVHYMNGRGNFSAGPFTVTRFLLMSSRDSVGGGPYVVEEAYPLAAPRTLASAQLSELRP
jgi:2'-5' RNA ligase